MDFKTLLTRYRKGLYTAPKTMLCLDPGFTTGVAVFKDGELSSWEQVTTIVETTKGTNILWDNLLDLFQRVDPTLIVCENYRVYQHKLDQHANSSVDTLRLIGGIDLFSALGWPIDLDPVYSDMDHDFIDPVVFKDSIPIRYQMATQAKGFCTDEKLKEWGYWQPGMKHSRDAIRHGCYYLLFSKEEVK